MAAQGCCVAYGCWFNLRLPPAQAGYPRVKAVCPHCQTTQKTVRVCCGYYTGCWRCKLTLDDQYRRMYLWHDAGGRREGSWAYPAYRLDRQRTYFNPDAGFLDLSRFIPDLLSTVIVHLCFFLRHIRFSDSPTPSATAQIFDNTHLCFSFPCYNYKQSIKFYLWDGQVENLH